MVNSSPALIWQLTRVTSSRSVKRVQPKVSMTWEKGAVRGMRRSFADSGYANIKAVDVDSDENGIPVLSLKNARACDARKPDKMWRSATLNGGVRKALKKTDTVLSTYRPASKKYAMAKVSKIYKAKARKDKGITHASVKAGRTVAEEEE